MSRSATPFRSTWCGCRAKRTALYFERAAAGIVVALACAGWALPALAGPAPGRSRPGQSGARSARSGRGAPPHCIPEDRLIDWRPGVEGGIPLFPVTSRLTSAELPRDGKTDVGPAIQSAIDGAKAPGAVLLPEGTFMLRQAVRLKDGVVLRGMGLDKTHILVDAPDRGFCGAVSFCGDWAGEGTRVLDGTTAGSRRLALESAAGLRPGQMVWLFSENDEEVMYGDKKEWRQDWARRSVGQMVRIAETYDRGVVVDTPVRLTRRQELEPGLRPLRSLMRAGLESMHIKGLDQAEGFLVSFTRAENCWIRDCELEYCMRAHVMIGESRFVTVEGNYVHHAYNYAGGGHGYGITMGSSATDCLVQNNVFRVLRHAMICGMGTNGNVWAYNYAREQLDDSDRWRLRDISVHGHYPYMELFEGNVAEFATSSDWWGAAGPLVTFFRNRFDTSLGNPGGWNAPLQILNASHRHNVVGNSLVSGQGIDVHESCRDTLVEGNLVKGRIVWNEARVRRIPASLFLDEKPHFWGGKPWPATGADVDFARGANPVTLPAQDWYAVMDRGKRAVPFSRACPAAGERARKKAGGRAKEPSPPARDAKNPEAGGKPKPPPPARPRRPVPTPKAEAEHDDPRDPPEAVQILKSAETLFIEGNADEARLLFERVVKEYPGTGPAERALEYLKIIE